VLILNKTIGGNMKHSETLSKLATALVKAQAEIKFAAKDSSNPFFKSKYADLPAVIEAVKPALNKHGISFLQIVTLDGVETMLLHESGEFISGVTPVVTAKANDPQALGSAISYAKRYGLQAIVGVPADVDDDGESAMGRTKNIPAAKVKTNDPFNF
jgi:hypothetical protein